MDGQRTFADRTDAGRQLAARLLHLRHRAPVVVALPRGGVPVARAVADALGAPLDVLVVRKIGAPHQPELAIGALAEGGVHLVDDDLVRRLGVAPAALAAAEDRARTELAARVQALRGDRARLPLAGRTVVVVDDGVATGSSARAACLAIAAEGADHVVLAAPVALGDWRRRLGAVADELVAVHERDDLPAVGLAYDDFRPVEDAEARAELARRP